MILYVSQPQSLHLISIALSLCISISVCPSSHPSIYPCNSICSIDRSPINRMEHEPQGTELHLILESMRIDANRCEARQPCIAFSQFCMLLNAYNLGHDWNCLQSGAITVTERDCFDGSWSSVRRSEGKRLEKIHEFGNDNARLKLVGG